MFSQVERVILNGIFRTCKKKLPCKHTTKGIRTHAAMCLLSNFKSAFTVCKGYASAADSDGDVEYESNYDNINFEAIAKGDPEKIKLLKLFQLEVDVMYQQGEKVPKYIRDDQWEELLLLPNRSSRSKYVNFLWLNEVKRETKKMKQYEKRVVFESLKSKIESEPKKPDHIVYSLANNAIFQRIYEVQINRFYNYRAFKAMMFGYHLLIDCSYSEHMNRKELSSCVKQLVHLFGENRMHRDPFNLIFCNMADDNILYKKMKKTIPTLDDVTFPFNHTPKNYLELYPKEKLVYLTPHCKEFLHKFNPNDVYIVGALVDKSSPEPLSMAKAKRDGIRVAKFPLDKYLMWGCGIKSLPLNQVISIMNDIKLHNDWNIAFQHIPKRKLAVRSELDNTVLRDDELSVRSIRENYRRNIIYDLLLKERIK